MQFDIDHEMCTISLVPEDRTDAERYVQALRGIPTAHRSGTDGVRLADLLDSLLVKGYGTSFELSSIGEETAVATALELAEHPDFNRFCDALEDAQNGEE